MVEMMMMIPMMSSSMTMAMASISPSGREFPRRIPTRRRALFSLVSLRPAEAAMSILRISRALGFQDEEVREGEAVEGGCGPPPHKAARPGQGPRRPMGGPMAALLGPSFWLAPSCGEIRPSV